MSKCHQLDRLQNHIRVPKTCIHVSQARGYPAHKYIKYMYMYEVYTSRSYLYRYIIFQLPNIVF